MFLDDRLLISVARPWRLTTVKPAADATSLAARQAKKGNDVAQAEKQQKRTKKKGRREAETPRRRDAPFPSMLGLELASLLLQRQPARRLKALGQQRHDALIGEKACRVGGNGAHEARRKAAVKRAPAALLVHLGNAVEGALVATVHGVVCHDAGLDHVHGVAAQPVANAGGAAAKDGNAEPRGRVQQATARGVGLGRHRLNNVVGAKVGPVGHSAEHGGHQAPVQAPNKACGAPPDLPQGRNGALGRTLGEGEGRGAGAESAPRRQAGLDGGVTASQPSKERARMSMC